MNDVRLIRESLEEVARILEAAGKKAQTKAVRTAIELFSGHDADTFATFLSELQERVKPKPKKKAARTPDLRTDAIDDYVQRLQAAGTDKSAFDTVFVELSKDKKAVRKGEADAIAHAYTRGRTQWPKKQDAIDAIKVHFDEQAYDETKMRQVDKASRW
jgi:hypothetical protein